MDSTLLQPDPSTGSPGSLQTRRLGLVDYREGLQLQVELISQRRDGAIPDTLLLLQHPHVITLGSAARAENILLSAQDLEGRGIEVHPAGRGGDVTYHGPGQLVGYSILDLKPDRCDLHRYLRDIEEVLIRVLSDLGLKGGRMDGLTGVWVGDSKVAAIGVRVSSGWITSHGFALNVSPDLDFFSTIVPCGIADHGVGSIQSELGRALPMADVEDVVEARFREMFSPR